MIGDVNKYGTAPYKFAVIHGGPGGIGSAKDLAKELGRHAGTLELLQSKYTVSELVEELKLQLEEYAPITLIGHSWGAYLSAIFARKYSEMVNKLILVSTPVLENCYVAKLHQNRLNRFSNEQKTEYFSIIENIKTASLSEKDFLLNKLGTLCSIGDSYELLDERKAISSKFDGEMYKKVWNEAEQLRSDGEILKVFSDLKSPVYLINGGVDPSPAIGVSEPLNRLNIKFYSIILDKCGHTPWREKYAKKKFLDLILTI